MSLPTRNMARFLRGLYRGNLGYRWVYNPAGTLGRFDAMALLYGSPYGPGATVHPPNVTDYDGNPPGILLSVQWGERVPLNHKHPYKYAKGLDRHFLFGVLGEVYRTGDTNDEVVEDWTYVNTISDPTAIEAQLAADGYTGPIPCNLFEWYERNSGLVSYHPNDDENAVWHLVYRNNGGLGSDITPEQQPGAASIYTEGAQQNNIVGAYIPLEDGYGLPLRADITGTDDQGNIVESHIVWLVCRRQGEPPKNEQYPTTQDDPNLLYAILAVTALLAAILALAPIITALLAELLTVGISEAALAATGEELAAALNSPQITAALQALRSFFFNKAGPVAVAAAAAYGGVQSAQQTVAIAVTATAAGDIQGAEAAYQQAVTYIQTVEQQIQRIGR